MMNSAITRVGPATNVSKPGAVQPAAPANNSDFFISPVTATDRPVSEVEKIELKDVPGNLEDGRQATEDVRLLRDQSTRFETAIDDKTGERIFKHVVVASGYVLWQYPEKDMQENARQQNKTEGVYADLWA